MTRLQLLTAELRETTAKLDAEQKSAHDYHAERVERYERKVAEAFKKQGGKNAN